MSNYTGGRLQLEAKNTSWTKIFNYVPEGSLVLDVGSSSGELGSELKKRKGCIVYGTEIDKGDYLKSKKILDKAFLFNIENDPLPAEVASKKFDAVIFADVIEHLRDPVEALKRVRGLLSKDGRIIFSIPNMAHISVRLQLLNGRFPHAETGLIDRTHLHFYDSEEVKRVFGDAGLKVKEFDTNSLPYPPSYLKNKLVELGLKDEGFVSNMQSDPQSRIFQIVGFAVVGEPKSHARLNTTTPEHDLIEYIENLHVSEKSARTIIEDQQLQLDKLEKSNQELTHELDRIRNSLAWKIISKAGQPIYKIVGKR